MALQTSNDRAYEAQRAWDNQADARLDQAGAAEQAADLAVALRNDPAACREAEQWTAGTFDGDHYTDVTLALHQLHHTDPADLLGSDLLAQLYALAKVEADAIDAQLLDMALQQVAA